MPIPVPGGEEARSMVIQDFAGLNTRAKRPAIADEEFSWLENFYPIGNGNLRTVYDKGATLYTAPAGRTILHYVPYNIGSTSYIAVFLDNGTAYQVAVVGGAITTISATANTFYNASSIPAAAQWKSEYLVIVGNASDNGYWLWNGSALFGAGTLSPDITILNSGSNYSSAPTVTAFGGSGSGATFSASVANGVVTQITCTNPGSGYLLNEHPVLLVTGGGSDNGVGLAANVTASSGGLSRIEVIEPGAGYTGALTVSITGGGASVDAEAVVTAAAGGGIYGITVINPGRGYTSAPTITVSGGTTAAVLRGHVTRGQVTSYTIAFTGGSGYDVPPTVAVIGDGIGATATTTLLGGAVATVVVGSAGYGYTWAKAVITSGNDAATATCDLMPFGINGNTVETYQSRVWVGDGTKGQFTAPASTSNFATSAGGGAYPATESFLRRQITRYFQSNGFLYQIGDSSINVISNVQTAGSPPSTSFNNANVDPQVGTAWPNTVQAFGRALVFANPLGVYALYGGAAEKVSNQLDGLFEVADFTTITPTASIATIFGIRCYCLHFRTTDKYSGTTRNIMAMWDGQNWFIGTQTVSLRQVATQEIDSIIDTWGCSADGKDLFKLYQTPSASLTKVFQTKLRAGETYIGIKQALNFYLMAESNHVDGATFNIAINALTSENGYVAGSAVAVPHTYALGAPALIGFDDDVLAAYGQLLGITATTTAKDATVISMTQLYREWAPEA